MSRWGRMSLVMVVVLVLLATMPLLVTAQEEAAQPVRTGFRPDAPTYAVRDFYSVGTREFVIEDEDRPLSVTVWYPALNLDGMEEHSTYEIGMGQYFPEMVFEGVAIPDATPDLSGGPYPLVIYSHGLAGYRQHSLFLTEHLASHGFVVFAPQHLGNSTPEFMDGIVDEALMTVFAEGVMLSYGERPADTRRVINFAAELANENTPLAGLVDSDNVAVMGWSFGGYTSWAAGGARLDFAGLAAWCAANPELERVNDLSGGPSFCFLGDYQDQVAAINGLSAVPEGLWPSLGDERVQAIVALAGWGVPVFGEDGLAAMDTPTMMITGGGDFDTPPEYNSYRAYDYLSSPTKAVVVLEHGWHGLFSNKCIPAMIELGFYPYCSDFVWDMDRAHDLINHFTTAFLLDTLKGDADAHAALLAENVAFPGVTYETTMD